MNEVEHVINRLLPDIDKRESSLQAFREAVRYANSCASDKWGVYYDQRNIRLLVGGLIVFTIHRDALWLALDQQLLESSIELSSALESYQEWQWDDRDYPRYKQVPSRNGFYKPSNNHRKVWNDLKQLNFELISKAANKYAKLREGTKHSPDLIEYLFSEESDFLQPLPTESPEVIEAISVIQDIAGKPRILSGQGFQSSPEARRAIELRAMKLATEHFCEQGWQVEDVSKYESYDLLCTRLNEELYVEVKGTTSAGVDVMLTAQEVIHAKQHYPKTALLVVSQIKLINSASGLEAIEGQKKLYQPWLIDDDRLRALSYKYQVPDT